MYTGGVIWKCSFGRFGRPPYWRWCQHWINVCWVNHTSGIPRIFAGGLIGYSTENGVIGTSFGRATGDNSWNYIRIFPHVAPHIQYKPVAENVFEFVFLESTPSLVVSNSNDPPGSFHSSDCFSPHPTISNAYVSMQMFG